MKMHQHKRAEMESIHEGAKRWKVDKGRAEKDSSNISITVNTIQNNEDTRGQDQQVFQLEVQEGRFRYQLVKYDYARICVQSLTASVRKPTFFSLHVKEVDAVHTDLEDIDVKDGLTEEQRWDKKKITIRAMEHSNWLEHELVGLIARVNSVERTFITAKEVHADFYAHSVEMHGSFAWFAKTQLLILIVAGFLNFRTMIRFLKKKGFIH